MGWCGFHGGFIAGRAWQDAGKMHWAWQLSSPELYNVWGWFDQICFTLCSTSSSAWPPSNTHVDQVREFTRVIGVTCGQRPEGPESSWKWTWDPGLCSNQPTPELCKSHTEAEVKNVVEPTKLVLRKARIFRKDCWLLWSPPWFSQPKGFLLWNPLEHLILYLLHFEIFFLHCGCFVLVPPFFSLCLILKAYI